MAKMEGEEAWRRLGGFLVGSGSGVCICGRVKDEWGGGEGKLEPVFLHCRGVDIAAEGALRVM